MRYLGTYDTIPLSNDSDTYKFQQDFGFLRDDGFLIISPTGTTTDGASIPPFPPVIRMILGHPLAGTNKLWAAPHDSLYRKCTVIIDTSEIDPDFAFLNWRELSADYFRHQDFFDRKFADETLLMALKYSKKSFLKRWAVYRMVRRFGRGWWGSKNKSK